MGLYAPLREPGRAVPALQALHGAGVFNRPVLPPGFRYLLLGRTTDQGDPLKPAAFHDLGALARHLHRARGEGGLQLQDTKITFAGADQATDGVSVWRLDPLTHERRSLLGWAWIDGASRWTLEAALITAQPGPVH